MVMTETLKLYLICDVDDNEGAKVEYKKVNTVLWKLQEQTRTVKNKAVQLCWEWYDFQQDYKEKYKEYPLEKDVLRLSLVGYIYSKVTKDNYIHTGNLLLTVREVYKYFKKKI